MAGLEIDEDRARALQPAFEQLRDGLAGVAGIEIEDEQPAVVFRPHRD
jgi:hypothetical protein